MIVYPKHVLVNLKIAQFILLVFIITIDNGSTSIFPMVEQKVPFSNRALCRTKSEVKEKCLYFITFQYF